MTVATEILDRARTEGRNMLSEIECKRLLKDIGIPATETELARTKEEAIALAKRIGLPVVLKIVSPQVVHKTDVGGVKLNLADEAAVGAAYDDILSAVKAHVPDAVIEGVAVQAFARPGTEVIVGMSKDPQFGPVLMFGLGGILVEVLKDVSFRIVPLLRRDAHQMITEIKAYPILEGYRGMEPADIAALEGILLKLSEFVDAHPEIKEMDLNPVLAYRDGAIAVDARIILE